MDVSHSVSFAFSSRAAHRRRSARRGPRRNNGFIFPFFFGASSSSDDARCCTKIPSKLAGKEGKEKVQKRKDEARHTAGETNLPDEPEANPERAPELRPRPVGTAATALKERTPRIWERRCGRLRKERGGVNEVWGLSRRQRNFGEKKLQTQFSSDDRSNETRCV